MQGGMEIVWTSDLLEHLTFESPNRLRLFRHVSALSAFDSNGLEEQLGAPCKTDSLSQLTQLCGDFFHVDLLSETRMALNLLSRPHDVES
jgi:hypothetical protein